MAHQQSRHRISPFLGARGKTNQYYDGEQKIHLSQNRSKPDHILFSFVCFPQKHSPKCKWKLDILRPEDDAPDAIYVEIEEHNHHLDPTDYNIAVAKREAYVCVQEDTTTPVDQILLDLCKKNRLTRSCLSDFAATCGHLKRRREEHLKAGHFIPEPSMPLVPPQRLEAAAPQPGKLLEVETAPSTSPMEATEDEATEDEATEDEATEDEATEDEATEDAPSKCTDESPFATCASEFDEFPEESTENVDQGDDIAHQPGSEPLAVQDGRVSEEEEEPQMKRKRVSGGSVEDLAKKKNKKMDLHDIEGATTDLYTKAMKELACASMMRREAEELRKQTEIAHQSATQLQQCTADAHRLAEEQLRSAMESKRHAEQLATTNQGIEKKLERMRAEAEKDRQQAAEMEIKAKELLEEATNLQEKAKEDRRLAAEVLSAVEEQKRLLTEVPKETENDRRKAKEMLAEITALWEKTSHEVEELSATVQPVSQPVEQRSDKPPEIFLDNDPVLPKVTYFEYNVPTHPPDERGIRHNVQKEVVISGPYLNVALQDPAVTAPHGTLPPVPTMCITCYDHLATCVVVPCGHTVLCGPCAATVQSVNKVCPVCSRGAYDMNGKLIVLKLYSC